MVKYLIQMCIKDEKEYGQPYFACNPHKAKNIQVN